MEHKGCHYDETLSLTSILCDVAVGLEKVILSKLNYLPWLNKYFDPSTLAWSNYAWRKSLDLKAEEYTNSNFIEKELYIW